MKELAARDETAEFRFIGGDYMSEVGGVMTVHYKDLAFMGFLEVLRNLGTIRKYLNLCKKDIEDFSPDAIILIDYAGFNLRIAKWAKKKNFRVFYYISPKLWAWNSKRAYKIKKYVDYMFAIMPFEPDFYKQYDYYEVSYVGNPVVDAVNSFTPDEDFIAEHRLKSNHRKIIAVLPGSRKQELSFILPDITKVVKRNQQHHYLVAAVSNLDASLYDELRELDNVELVTGNTYDILSIADAAIATSGTATLETALWDVPQVVLYKGSAISIWIAKKLVRIKYISLVNLILDEPCVAELIQEDCNPEKIEQELNLVLDKPTDYSRLHNVIGQQKASENTAIGIISALKKEEYL